MRNTNSIKLLSSKLLAKEAVIRNITVQHLNPYQKGVFLELNYKKHKEFIIDQRISKTSLSAYWILENKELTKHYLRRSKLSVAQGEVFQKKNKEEIFDYCKKIGFPVVAKPILGAHGRLVFIGIKNKKALKSAIGSIFRKEKYVLIEKEFIGKEYRFTATRKKVLAVMYREPANVVGDGVHTIGELIRIKNKDPRRGEEYEKVLCKIKIDKIVKRNLAEQNLKLNSVLSKGQKIYLRKNSNLSTGGDSIDLTDETHPELKKIAVKAINAIPGLAYGGVDLMSSRNISQKPANNSYVILEVNSSPGISMHYDPIEGETRDVAKDVIDLLFPETNFFNHPKPQNASIGQIYTKIHFKL